MEYIFLENLKKSNSNIKFNKITGKIYKRLILLQRNIAKNNTVINVNNTDKNCSVVANAPFVSNFFLLNTIGR